MHASLLRVVGTGQEFDTAAGGSLPPCSLERARERSKWDGASVASDPPSLSPY